MRHDRSGVAVSRTTVGHRLFRWGRMPRRARAKLEAEGIQLLDEGVRIGVVYRNVRAAGHVHRWRCQIGSGSIVLTAERLAVFLYRWTLLNVRLDDRRLQEIEIEPLADDALRIAFDLSRLRGDASGRVIPRVHTARARDVGETLCR